MTAITINIKKERIDAKDGDLSDLLGSLFNPSKTPDGDTIDPENLQKLLGLLPPDALEIRQSTREPDWECGEPCPKCGNETLSAMAAAEDIYVSKDGEFEYVKSGDAIGPVLSVLCLECCTHLMHIPYQILTS